MNKLIISLLIAVIVCQRQRGSSSNCQNPSWWNGNRCECPRNMVNVNGKCTCDYGYLLKDNRCIQCFLADNSCKVESKDCFPGTIFNQSYCIHDWNTSYCGKGFYWNGIYCTRYVMPIVCQGGYRWNGQACVLSLVSKCPKGYFWNGNYCQLLLLPIFCTTGFKWDALAEGCVAQDIRKCQEGNVWNGAVCVSRQNLKCQAGTYFNGQLCVAIGNNFVASCAAGFYWNGRLCSSVTPRTCFQKFLYDQLSASCLMFLCPKDNVFDSISFTCAAKAQVTTHTQRIETPLVQFQPTRDQRQGGIAVASPGFLSVAQPGELAIDSFRLKPNTVQPEPIRTVVNPNNNEGTRQIGNQPPRISQTMLTVPETTNQNIQQTYQIIRQPSRQSEMSNNQGIVIGGSSFTMGNARAQGGDAMTLSENSARYSAGSISDSSNLVPLQLGLGPEVESLLGMANQARAMNEQEVIVQRY